jgi:hypothetical protein
MAYPLRKRRRPSKVLRFLTCREWVTAMMLLVIALLTWALLQDRGVLIPYRDKLVNQIHQTPLYGKDDLHHQTVTLEDLR